MSQHSQLVASDMQLQTISSASRNPRLSLTLVKCDSSHPYLQPRKGKKQPEPAIPPEPPPTIDCVRVWFV